VFQFRRLTVGRRGTSPSHRQPARVVRHVKSPQCYPIVNAFPSPDDSTHDSTSPSYPVRRGIYFDSARVSPGKTGDRESEGRAATPFLGIRFQCCRQYARIYRTSDGTSYRGCCPKCGAAIEVPIRKGGTGNRFFTAE